MKIRPSLLSSTLLAAVALAALYHPAPARAQSASVAVTYTDDGSHHFFGPTILGSDGYLYGTAQFFPPSGCIYKIGGDGLPVVLHVFSERPFDDNGKGGFNVDGAFPFYALTQGSDGNFYGTTSQGGASNYGTFFQITPDGTLTTLRSFSEFELQHGISGPLTEGDDGSFYAEASDENYGRILRLGRDGNLSVTHEFTAAEGSYPYNGLVKGQDGSLYGVTNFSVSADGTTDVSPNGGTVFKLLPDGGGLTVLHTFTGGPDGGEPTGLLDAGDGTLFGSAAGGNGYAGTFFKIAGDGTFNVLRPEKVGLSRGRDGNFYELGNDGSVSGTYTLSRVSPDGMIKTALSTFSPPPTTYSTTPPTEGALAGEFYFSTSGNAGAIFRAQLYTVAKPVVTLSAAKTTIDSNGDLGAAKVVVKRDGNNLASALTVHLAIKGGAANGTDYDLVAPDVVIPAGATKAKVKFSPKANGITSGSKSITVKAKAKPTDAYTVGDPAKVVLILNQNG